MSLRSFQSLAAYMFRIAALDSNIYIYMAMKDPSVSLCIVSEGLSCQTVTKAHGPGQPAISFVD